MAWEEEDDQEQSGPLAVARAMSGSDEGAVPEQMPDTVAKTQAVSESGPAAAQSAPEDEQAQVLADYPYDPPDDIKALDGQADSPQGQTASAEQPTQQATVDTGEDGDLASYVTKPLEAPKMPAFKPYSQAPIEAAQQLAQAKSSFDPSKYKPSAWRRLGAGLSAAMVAAGSRNSEAGMQVGLGVLHAPLERAQAQEAQKEAGLRAGIDAGNVQNQAIQQENNTAANSYNMQERDMRNRGYVEHQNALSAQERANAQSKLSEPVGFTPADPTNPYAGGTVTTRGGKQVPNSAPPKGWIQEWSKSPQGQAATARMTVQTRKQLAADMNLKPGSEDYNEFVANGKIARSARTSIHVPSADSEKYNDWKAQFQQDNNRAPSAAEIAGYGHVATGAMSKPLGDKIEKDKNAAIQKAIQDHSGDPAAAIEAWQDAQDTYEQRLKDATGNDIPHVVVKDNVDPNTLQWHGAAPAQQPAAPQGNQQPKSPAPQQSGPKNPYAPPAPAGDGEKVRVPVVGTNSVFQFPKEQMREGRQFKDEKGQIWTMRNGQLVKEAKGKV